MAKRKSETVISFVMITIGAMIAAFAIEEFLVPCTILDGGVIGIGIMIKTLTGIPLGILSIVLNVPFVVFGYFKLGKLFAIRAVYAIGIFSLFAEIFAPLQNATDQYLLAVCFGGLILGFGVGLVIRFGGCLDGTEAVAIILDRKYKISVGKIVLVFNVVIYTVAAFLFGIDRAMYSLLTYIITSKIIDFVETGIDKAKAAMIITNDAQEVSEKIYARLGRTVTMMEGEGLVSGKKVVLYCVITRFEVRELREIIASIDESAFVAISDVTEIIGRHIKKKGGDINEF